MAVGYVGSVYGVEAGYSFYHDRDSIMRSWQVTVGSFQVEDSKKILERNASGYRWRHEDENWTYIGVSGTFQFGGFFLEPGISFGSGDYSNPQLTLQAGWLWSL